MKKSKNSIRDSFNMLNEHEKATVKICSVLCTEEGVSLRSLFEIIGDDTHTFGMEMKNILRTGLLIELAINRINCPREVKTFLSKNDVDVEVINSVIKRLQEKTQLSIDDADLLQPKPYFDMANAMMQYIVQHSDDVIEYEVFARLLVNITRYYEIYAQPYMSISDNKQLPLMKAIELVKSKVSKHNRARLCSSQAFIYLSGFYYDDAKRLIDEALSTESISTEALSYTYWVSALWNENFGKIGDCLAQAYKCWEVAEDEALRDYVAIYIAYELALLDEFETSQKWMIYKIKLKYPKCHTVSIFEYLILALKNYNNESLAEDYLRRAESILNQINNNAPIKARIMYVKSLIESKWGLQIEANAHYRDYATIIARHYAPTDGATYIYIAGEVDRLTSIGALTEAKHFVNDKLDSFPIMHPGYSLSVKLYLCQSYINLYRSCGWIPLAETYYKLALDFAIQTIPSVETLRVLKGVFVDSEIPESLTGVALEWTLEYEHLQNLQADKKVSESDIKKQIKLMEERFPVHQHQQELELISASLLDVHACISTFYRAISHADQSEKYQVCLQCARIAVSLGYIWEAADLFMIMLNTEGYKQICRIQLIDIQLEIIMNLENCGKRRDAKMLWTQLEALARGTSKLMDVWQARGNCCFNAAQYAEALRYYNRCIAVVHPEHGLIDQRISSLYSFRASCFAAIGKYHEAYDDAVKAKQYFPMGDFDGFSLEYNHGFFALCLNRYKEARIVLSRAKALAQTKEDKEAVDQLWSILAMKKEKRERIIRDRFFDS